MCPSGAFELDAATRKTVFHDKKCIACGLCIRACPPHAMALRF
jgi:NAD-dependent dihydropyrimidine dehydrogenase PreA subunit